MAFLTAVLVVMTPIVWREQQFLACCQRLQIDWFDINYDAMTESVMADPALGARALRCVLGSRSERYVSNCMEVCWRRRQDAAVRQVLVEFIEATSNARWRRWAQAVLDGTWVTKQDDG